MKRRALILTSAFALVATITTVAVDVALRARIDEQLENSGSRFQLHYSGSSAILALVTGQVDVTATLTPDDVAGFISGALPEAGEVEFTDGAVGVHVTLGRQDAVAWVTMAPVSDGVKLEVESLEIAGLALDPSLIMGSGAGAITLDDPLADCQGASLTRISVTPEAMHISALVSRDVATCLGDLT